MRDIEVEEIISLVSDLSNAQKTIIAKQERELSDLRDELYKSQETIRLLDAARANEFKEMTYRANDIAYVSGFVRGNPRKLDAIKAVREKFGYNLKEAKDLVDAIMLPNMLQDNT